MRKEKEIIKGTEITFNGKSMYYAKPLYNEEVSHLVYYFEDGWPFPQYLTLNRNEFKIKRLEKEKYDINKMQDAPF